MSDGDSILGAVADAGKDFVKETVKQVVGSGAASAKTATQQVAGYTSNEDEEKKKASQIATFQRIKAIEAEMAEIGKQNEKKTGPALSNPQTQQGQEKASDGKPESTLDEASRQAVGRAEQGRNFKG